MSASAIIIVGATGTGKTTFVKERLKNVHSTALHLYDINKEYGDFYKQPFTSFEKFTTAAQKKTDSVLVFEEATIFLSNRSSNDGLRDILVRKRHANNTIFLVFHSLRTIPRYIFDLSNYVVLFKTNDSETLVQQRFENELLTACFLRVKNNASKFHHEFFSIY